jgi:adenine-specific DNA-methyltransferase
VSEALQAVADLVKRVRDEAPEGASSAVLKDTLRRVLADLGVTPGDPAWTDGRDVVGAAYERLIAGSERRALGQFFTPLWVGRVMARWLLAERAELLIDPGCGSGSLLAAAAEEREDVKTRLLGIDVDPLAIEMAKSTYTVRGIVNAELRVGDFLLDPLSEAPTALLCNPPYTRHHAIPKGTKQAIHAGFANRLGVEFSQLASMHVLFLVRALEVAGPNARLAFVTPAHWLDMNYSRRVKEFLLNRAHVEAIVGFPADDLLFDHAVTTATITLINKREENPGMMPTRLLRAETSDVDAISKAIADPDQGETVQLFSKRKWSHATAPVRRGVRLDELADVRRGVATGCNAFFVISDETRRTWRLNTSYLVPCLKSPKLFPDDEIDEEAFSAVSDAAPRWLVSPRREWTRGPLHDYLQFGIREYDLLNRHLVTQRVEAGRPWWMVETLTAPILFSYFNRPNARFVRNHIGAVPLNSWLAVNPKPGVDTDQLFAILRSKPVLNRLAEQSRLYGNGLWKLEPNDLRAIVLPPGASVLAHAS